MGAKRIRALDREVVVREATVGAIPKGLYIDRNIKREWQPQG